MWREIGPVQEEQKEDLWNRFKNATTQINKAHQDYFTKLKEQEISNLEVKTALCEKVEDILQQPKETIKSWNTQTEEITNVQKIWKTVGFAPQKNNNQIYDRFCKACNSFFKLKREFFEGIKEIEDENQQKKLDLCIQAEKMITRTDWKEASAEFVKLQKAWKEIGPVSQKESNKLWARFKQAGDDFFKAKQEFYQGKESEQEKNLELKLEIIKKISELEITENAQDSLKELQKLQKDWAEIGFIPAKNKDKIQQEYRDILQKKFDSINLPLDQKQKAMFKVKVESMYNENKGSEKIGQEATKLQNKLKSLENDIILLENNIGFFAKSKNADKLIAEVQNKIQVGKKEIENLKQQIRVIHSVKDNK